MSTSVSQPVVASSSVVQNVSSVAPNPVSPTSTPAPVLPAGLWLRVVLGFQAPFGFDGMPTVWD